MRLKSLEAKEKFIRKTNNYIAIILGIVVLLFIIGFLVYLKTKPPEGCEVISGNKHIYKGQCLSEGYEPETVYLPERYCWLNTKQKLHPEAAKWVIALINAAERDGMCLVVTSGYRSYEEQQMIYERNKFENPAKPGASEHQTGLAVDFAACPMNEEGKRDDNVEREELEKPFKELPEYDWLKLNAFRAGFEQSYTKQNQELTGYPPEPWHWKFIKE